MQHPDTTGSQPILCPHLHRQGLTNHVLANVRHGVKLLLADLAGELLLCVAMHYLVVLVKRPQLLKGFATRHALREKKSTLAATRSYPWPLKAGLFLHLKSAGKKAGPAVPRLG